MDQTLEITKLVNILKSPSTPEEEKMLAERRLGEIKYQVERRKYAGIPDDRIDDIMELERIAESPATPEHYREVARKGIDKIINESKIIRSMRKSLVKAMKDGDSLEVRDITDYVNNHKHLQ
jgi:hypothetical protein